MTWHFNVFKKMGVDGPTPTPISGNMKDLVKLVSEPTLASFHVFYKNVYV